MMDSPHEDLITQVLQTLVALDQGGVLSSLKRKKSFRVLQDFSPGAAVVGG